MIGGASVAWHLISDPGFDGRVLVVERDPSYQACSTAHTNSCIRMQFSTPPLNVKVSQYGVDYIKNFRARMGGDERVPEIHMHAFGYMYLAGDEAAAEALRVNQAMQAGLGAETRLLTPPDQIAADYPFYDLEGIVLGSHNPVDEGYFDGTTMFDWWRRLARERGGVEVLHDEVVGMRRDGGRVVAVQLASGGGEVACGTVVNAAGGPRAGRVAAMAGLELPVEPRKRYTWVVEAARPLGGQDLPLTIDPPLACTCERMENIT